MKDRTLIIFGEYLGMRHFSTDDQKLPWYFRTGFIIIAIGCVGPLALPLVWWRPETKPAWKIGITIIILALSWILYDVTMESIRTLKAYYQMMQGM